MSSSEADEDFLSVIKCGYFALFPTGMGASARVCFSQSAKRVISAPTVWHWVCNNNNNYYNNNNNNNIIKQANEIMSMVVYSPLFSRNGRQFCPGDWKGLTPGLQVPVRYMVKSSPPTAHSRTHMHTHTRWRALSGLSMSLCTMLLFNIDGLLWFKYIPRRPCKPIWLRW